MNQSFVLKGDICYSKDPTTLHTLRGGYLVCVDGISQGVYAALPEEYAALPLDDFSGKMIVPGLVDLHMHAPQFAFRGLGVDLELLDWLNSHTFPEEAKYADMEYAEKAYSDMIADLKKGPNTRACLFGTLHLPATGLLMEKLEQSGMVSMVGKVNMDRNSPVNLCEQSAEKSAADTCEWLRQCAGKYRNTTPIITPRFVPSCSDELMRALAKIAREYRLPVQSHLAENQSEVAWVQQLCPASSSYMDAYVQYGLLDPQRPGIMAHCVWVSDEEIELMRQYNVYAAHCPQSNTNLSSGIAPVRKFMQLGLRVGLGSDVAGGCHSSVFRAMADAVQVSKLRWRLVDQDLAPLTVEEAFYLGTVGGGSFFGKVGSFASGYEFDAVVIDDGTLRPPFEPTVEERLARVIYLSDDRNVCRKYVRGTIIEK